MTIDQIERRFKPVARRRIGAGSLRPLATTALLLAIAGAGFKSGGYLRTRSPESRLRPLTQRAREVRNSLANKIALLPGVGDDELGLQEEAFPETLDTYWSTANTVLQHFQNPTPLTMFTATGRQIVADPQRFRVFLTYSGIEGVLGSLNDRYTRLLEPAQYKEMQQDNEGSFAGIGAQLEDKDGKIIIKQPLPDSPASKAGILPNDEIVEINGQSTAGIASEKAVSLIRGKVGTVVKLTLKRGSQLVTVHIVRAVINSQHFEYHTIGDIGYMHLLMFDEQASDNIDRALQSFKHANVRGLILDLRDNPGGLLNAAIDVSSKFIPPGPVVWVQERAGHRNALLTTDNSVRSRLPLALLVNHNSASASEIVSGAIKDNHAGTLVGLTTWGKGLVQEVIPLNDGSALALTIERYYTPNQIDINEKGVTPDIVVGHEVGASIKVPEAPTPAEIQKLQKEFTADADAVDKQQLDTALGVLHRQIGDSGSAAQRTPPSGIH